MIPGKFLTLKNRDQLHGLWSLEAVDEGSFKDGKWMNERRLNGDEIHASLFTGSGPRIPGNRVSIRKVILCQYK